MSDPLRGLRGDPVDRGVAASGRAQNSSSCSPSSFVSDTVALHSALSTLRSTLTDPLHQLILDRALEDVRGSLYLRHVGAKALQRVRRDRIERRRE